MVTARPPGLALRSHSRSRRVGPRRLLWLAVLLLGILSTHGLTAESAEGHVSPVAAVTSAHTSDQHNSGQHSAGPWSADQRSGLAQHSSSGNGAMDNAPCENRDGHAPDHPGHSCLAGQTEHGVGLPLPCPSCPEASPAVHAFAMHTVATTATALGAPPSAGRSAVLRI
ncbi:hypothetical protein [Streptomyces sp. NPDC093097]|uniref:hypothetical protein n=1 Tax=Streptomyces sp. NPDC093097 TaxID=3366027 RepID=UPI0038210D84